MSTSTPDPGPSSNRFAFTEARLRREAHAAPAGSRPTFYDTEVPRLAMRRGTAPTGGEFIVACRLNGRYRRHSIGPWPSLTVQAARDLARKMIGRLAEGIDPTDERRKILHQSTLRELWDWYERTHKLALRASTWRRYSDSWRLHLSPALAARRLSEVTRQDVQKVIDGICADCGASAASHACRVLSAVYHKAKLAPEIAFSGDIPTTGIRRPRIESRDRFMQPGELPRFFAALQEESAFWRTFWVCCLFTALRRSNVAQARWDEISLDLGRWVVPAGRAKGKEILNVPIPRQLLPELRSWQQIAHEQIDAVNDRRARLLARGETTRVRAPLLTHEEIAEAKRWVFPAVLVATRPTAKPYVSEVQFAWKRILKNADISDLRPHDLRRSMGSWMAIGGTSMPVIGAALGHKDLQSTAIYARLNDHPVRVAMEEAADQMLALAAPRRPAAISDQQPAPTPALQAQSTESPP